MVINPVKTTPEFEAECLKYYLKDLTGMYTESHTL